MLEKSWSTSYSGEIYNSIVVQRAQPPFTRLLKLPVIVVKVISSILVFLAVLPSIPGRCNNVVVTVVVTHRTPSTLWFYSTPSTRYYSSRSTKRGSKSRREVLSIEMMCTFTHLLHNSKCSQR